MNTGDHGGVNPEDLLAEAIVDDAVRRRRARGWARRRALDDVTIAATLVANVGDDVTVVVSTGEELRGTVVAAGTVVVLDAVAAQHWIRSDAIVAVTVDGDRLATSDGSSLDRRRGRDGAELAAMLADLVDTDRTVRIGVTGAAALSGVVSAVGASLVVTLPGGHRSVVGLDAVLTVAVER